MFFASSLMEVSIRTPLSMSIPITLTHLEISSQSSKQGLLDYLRLIFEQEMSYKK